MSKKEHVFWGRVEEDWAGFSAGITFVSNYFDKEVILFLGEEYDEEGEEIETTPTDKELTAYQKTYMRFLDHIEDIIKKIKKETFYRYKKLYAHYYENESKSGEKPLQIDSVEKHFKYITTINYIRILENDEIKILIHYKLDSEHGLELRVKNNQIVAIGGIAET
ncbi:hypothetical protein [Aquimarina sp. I32.4]|uniref:DUF6985 domain-containing protein n=1 Tax=Aquimarina sp. I32.4 TaxID=2053903 RepID=UPI000CDE5E6B|nr:hypothetical protein [Aquimarina sp. I32.4]